MCRLHWQPSGRGGASLLRSSSYCCRQLQATLFETPAVKDPWTPNAASTTNRSTRCGSSNPELSRQVFMCCSKGVFWYVRRKRWWCGCSVWACGGLIVDWRTTYALSLGERVSPQKCLWQLPVALQPEGSATTWTVSTDETDVEVVMLVSGAMRSRALVLFCKAIGAIPSSSCPKVLLARLVGVATVLTTVAEHRALCCERPEKHHYQCTCLTAAIVEAWSGTTRQTVWNRWCRRLAQSTVRTINCPLGRRPRGSTGDY